MKVSVLVAALIAFASPLIGAEPSEFSVGAFKFQRPSDWQWVVPTSPMRKAELAVVTDGGSAEITFFHFGPGQGGTVAQNISRWVGQFEGGAAASNAMQREETVGQTKVTYVSATGTFLSGMPGGPTTPKSGYRLLGAILESAEGDVYVKMTGPDPIVLSATPAFESMISSAADR